MKLKVKSIWIDSMNKSVIIHRETAEKMGIFGTERLEVSGANKRFIASVSMTDKYVEKDEVGIFQNIAQECNITQGETVNISIASRPESVEFIKKKMKGNELSKKEIYSIVKDMVDSRLTDIEMTAFVVSVAIRELNTRETVNLINAMVETGDVIKFNKHPVMDFHSIGGSPGNKITLIVVPIVTAADLLLPKTCSRAISSACGTADILEVIADVSLSIDEIKTASEKIGGVIAWGGGVNIAPADDIIIKVEYPLSLDPYSQLIASILAKKKAIGAEKLLIDIPTGSGTKVTDPELARRYARDFIDIGKKLGIDVQCAITYGGQPIGKAIGPALEVKEALEALEGKPVPTSLTEKAYSISGLLLEMGGAAEKGKGRALAREILESGKALKKFKEIVAAQRGNPDIKSEDIQVGKYNIEIRSETHGYIDHIDNKAVVKTARAAGAPHDKGAGIYFHAKKGYKVDEGSPLFTIYSNSKEKLDQAVKTAKKLNLITIEGMILEHISDEF